MQDDAPPAEPLPVAVAPNALGDAGTEDHCAEKHEAEPNTAYARSMATYELPDIRLADRSGQPFAVRDLASSERPVALNFIFATCTTICPVMTATFSKTRELLGPDADRVHFVSITIDPEHDTPAVLAEYAEKFQASPDWAFLTGDPSEVEAVLRSLDAWAGSKLKHEPITLLRSPGAEQWVRLDGLGSGTALAAEVRTILDSPGSM